MRLKKMAPISSSRDLIWFDTVDCAQFKYLAAWLKFKKAATVLNVFSLYKSIATHILIVFFDYTYHYLLLDASEKMH
jgi:hypothetical protein